MKEWMRGQMEKGFRCFFSPILTFPNQQTNTTDRVLCFRIFFVELSRFNRLFLWNFIFYWTQDEDNYEEIFMGLFLLLFIPSDDCWKLHQFFEIILSYWWNEEKSSYVIETAVENIIFIYNTLDSSNENVPTMLALQLIFLTRKTLSFHRNGEEERERQKHKKITLTYKLYL